MITTSKRHQRKLVVDVTGSRVVRVFRGIMCLKTSCHNEQSPSNNHNDGTCNFAVENLSRRESSYERRMTES